jgi:hypothetical protein
MASPPFNPFRRAQLLVLILVASGGLALSASSQTAPAGAPVARQPVLVELFTSEGCSDCPPADALMAQLDATQPIPGAQAIVLSEHVTYWNRLGWSDPFSLADVDERQEQYKDHFTLSSTYTPQAVVDGAAELVGSDSRALTVAVARAALAPKVEIAIGDAHWTTEAVVFSVRVPASASALRPNVTGVVAEDATESKVTRGENAGRVLHHVAVVRVLKQFHADALDGRPLKLQWPVLSHPEKVPSQIRLVVFLTDRKTGHVLAVAEKTLSQ